MKILQFSEQARSYDKPRWIVWKWAFKHANIYVVKIMQNVTDKMQSSMSCTIKGRVACDLIVSGSLSFDVSGSCAGSEYHGVDLKISKKFRFDIFC